MTTSLLGRLAHDAGGHFFAQSHNYCNFSVYAGHNFCYRICQAHFGAAMTGAELKNWRRARNYTQSMLALLLGVSKNTVSNYERGERMATRDGKRVIVHHAVPRAVEMAIKQIEMETAK